MNYSYPFCAIVGQSRLKQALLLNLVDPSIGGVLVIGDKGTGKTSLIRSLADLADAPFVNLPLGASEDRVLGHLNLGRLINLKEESLQIGLLGKADMGWLYIDEINLLNDYLMDILLDASATGSYFLEREGLSKEIKSRFCLVGSMNLEEGDLRPQLKDRFGFALEIKTPDNLSDRKLIIKRKIAFERDPISFVKRFQKDQNLLIEKISLAQMRLHKVKIDEAIMTYCAKVALENNVEGVRADILLMKAAIAHCALEGYDAVSSKHVDQIASLVLLHRTNKSNNHQQCTQEDNGSSDDYPYDSQSVDDIEDEVTPNETIQSFHRLKNKRSTLQSDSEDSENVNLASGILINGIDKRKTIGQYLASDEFELKKKLEERRKKKHVIFILDSSGSMLTKRIVAFAKGFIQKTISENNSRTMYFSLISLSHGVAKIVADSRLTQAQLIEKLTTLKSGGQTSSTEGFKLVKSLISNASNVEHDLVLITDGRFNTEYSSSFKNAVKAYKTYCKQINQTYVIDAERGGVRLGLANDFAREINGMYEQLQIN